MNQLRNINAPLLIVEGEFKSVSVLSSALASNLDVAVVGLPGVSLPSTVTDELGTIPCMVSTSVEEVHRDVYLCFDWNEPGGASETLRTAEARLTRLFENAGAQVFTLRWDAPESAGPQKVDDWLVAGGDLSAALRQSRERRATHDTELQAEWDRLNSTYAIHYGVFVPLVDHGKKLNAKEFNIMEAFHTRPEGRRMVSSLERWGRQPNHDRNVINGFVFHPGPLGSPPDKYVWRGDQRMLNIAKSVSWPQRSPWDEPVGTDQVSPFLHLIEHLCNGEGSEWLTKFIAQAAQFPTERGPHVVIFAGAGGSGKNTLLEFLGDVFGEHACNKVDQAFTSSFNDELENLILAYRSEPQKNEQGIGRNLLARLKNYSGDAMLPINHKYGNKYTVRNYGRLFILMNEEWIVPVEEDERRFTVFGPRGPIDREFIAKFKRWAQFEGGVNLVREYLLGVDLSAFDVHAPGPHTSRRNEMVASSAHPIRQWLFDANAGDEGLSARDVWSVGDLRFRYGQWSGTGPRNPREFSAQLKKAGCSVGHVVKVKGVVTRLAIVRNVPQWLARAEAEGLFVLAEESLRGDPSKGSEKY